MNTQLQHINSERKNMLPSHINVRKSFLRERECQTKKRNTKKARYMIIKSIRLKRYIKKQEEMKRNSKEYYNHGLKELSDICGKF